MHTTNAHTLQSYPILTDVSRLTCNVDSVSLCALYAIEALSQTDSYAKTLSDLRRRSVSKVDQT